MLWTHVIKAFSEKLNDAGTKIDINLKNHQIWGCPVYFLDAILQVNIAGLTNLEPQSHVGMYFGHPPFHAVSVALDINPSTFHFSPQFHVMFDDEFSTVPFMREGTIPTNWTDLVQRRSQSCAPYSICINDACFTSDIEEYPSETPSHESIIAQDNNNNTLTLLQYIPHLQEIPARKGVPVSEVIKRQYY